LTSNAGNKRKLGCISFGYLFFVQAKKSNSLKKRKETLQPNPNAKKATPPECQQP